MFSHLHPDEKQPLLSDVHDNATSTEGESGSQAQPTAHSNGGVSRHTLLVVGSILATELCERLTYYSVVGNIVLYCTSQLNYHSITATNINFVFQGTVALLPVVGGYVADAVAGRYKTIIGSGFIYILGLFLLLVSAVDFEAMFGKDQQGRAYNLDLTGRRTSFLTGLMFIGVGTGGIKANVGPFGAQQLEQLGAEAVQSFFNWFYWFINMGGLLAFSGVSYIQQEVGFSSGFLVPLISMSLALPIFLSARRRYIHLQVQGSVLTKAFKICRAGCKKSPSPGEKLKYFDKARASRGGQFDDYTVDGVIRVLRILPIFLPAIIYWAIYSQMSSTFFLQGERLDVTVGQGKLPVAILNVFNTVTILILIPIVDRLVYPFFTRTGRPLTHLKRMGIGFVLASLSVVAAGELEINRRAELRSSGGVVQELGGETFNSSHISIFVQVPQFALIGASEVFASISGLEFAYTQAHPSMQGLVTGLYLAAVGLGNYLSMAITNIVVAATQSDPWFPNEINDGKLENLFFFLGGLMVLNIVVFIFIARSYKYRDVGVHPPADRHSGWFLPQNTM